MKTIFLRVLEASVDDKPEALRQVIASPEATQRFEMDPASFEAVPKSPFAYWTSEGVRCVFERVPAFSEGQLAIRGAYTTDDFRFYRLGWEAAAGTFASDRSATLAGSAMVNLAKGGGWSPYYYDVHLAVRWGNDGAEAKAFLSSYRERKGWGTDWSACLNGYGEYFRPGLTWPRRTQGGLSLRAMPAGCIFADKGPSAFVADDVPEELLALLGVVNSAAFRALVELQMAFGSYEVGVIQRTPVPDPSDRDRDDLAALARRAWSLKRSLDTRNETSHAFALPALLQAVGSEQILAQRRRDAETNPPEFPLCASAPLREINPNTQATRWADHVQSIEAELATIQAEIDERCFDLYGIDEADRRAITQGFGASTEGDEETPDDEEEDTEAQQQDAAALAEELLSWAVGVALGRFDVRLATQERPLPKEPEPFDPLPVCSPGMLTGDDGLPLAKPPAHYPIPFPEDGVLVDDLGHPRDLLTSLRHVFDVAFQGNSDAWWRDVSELLDPKDHDLRAYLANRFFEPHLKRYSKSRRKAPIYWQLATPSARYSVWLYAHRLTQDTFFSLLNDVVGPKLAHETGRLTSLIQNAGPNPSASQRKEIEPLESLVDELRAMLDELKRVAPLWSPNLDDGVVLVMAPLWRLVPQHAGWQKELRTKWEELCEGTYDWAQVAMHLWPERVVPRCAGDRSLAIAHGLEDELWLEDADGKWRKRDVTPERIEALIAECTSPAVKSALASLLSAPAKSASSKKRGPRRRNTPLPPRPAKPRADRDRASVDEPTLAAVRNAIANAPGGASKSDVLEATGLSPAEWTRAIATLLERGEVTQSGQKRGTRYHALTTSTPGGGSS